MAVSVISGTSVDGVEYGTAPGTGHGYVVGNTPALEMLRVDADEHPARLVGIKYSHHFPTDLPKGPRPVEKEQVRITMLVSGGPWQQTCWRSSGGSRITLLLQKPGDFIAWGPGIVHEWMPLGNASMLTIGFVKTPPIKSLERTREG
jgi:hypothetical protein